jgi:hypothetical protein
MKKNDNTPKTREEIFAAKAESYPTCYSTSCPLREHCLHSILRKHVPEDKIFVLTVNLNNPHMQQADCPQYRKDEPTRMPYGLKPTYRDMPARMERAVKNHLIDVYTRKRYYEYHKGTRPLTPDVEAYVREALHRYGWKQDPLFLGYVEEFLW